MTKSQTYQVLCLLWALMASATTRHPTTAMVVAEFALESAAAAIYLALWIRESLRRPPNDH